MKEIEVEQKKLIHWFSGLTVKQCQKSAQCLGKILSEIRGLKETNGNTCMWCPCQKSIYARGLCMRHYQLVMRLSKCSKTDSSVFAGIGIIKK